MNTTAGVANVVFDAASRRYEGQVHIAKDGTPMSLRISAPGHPAWPHRRIKAALIASAQAHQQNGASHARA